MKSWNSNPIKIVLVVLTLAYVIVQSTKGGDFSIYMGAAELLKEGRSCYNVWIHLGGENYCGYSYSPIFAILLIPFTYFPKAIPPLIWLLLNLIFLYRISKIIHFYLNFSSFPSKDLFLWRFLAIAVSLKFILHNFEMIQMTIFLVYCCLESMYQIYKKQYFSSGIILSIGIGIKILPIVLLPYLIYRGVFKSVFITIIGIGLLLLFPAFIYGWDFNIALLLGWWETINPCNQFLLDENITGEGIHSLSGFIPAYFSNIKSTVTAPFSRILFELEKDNISLLLNFIRFLLIGFTLYFIQSLPFNGFKNKLHTFWECAYILAVIPLIFPHQQKYAFFFLMPASSYLLYFLISKKKHWTRRHKSIAILVILFFLLSTFAGLLGNNASALSQYYKTITFGSFFLLLALVISNPKKLAV